MKYLLLTVFALASVSCGHSVKTKNNAESKAPTFEVPQIPQMLEGSDAAKYIANHYWDNFDFADTAYVELPEVTEQAFSDYIYILNNMNPDVAATAIYEVMNKARADSAMHSYFMDLSEKYLYDPNSPMRNEELYIPVLRNMLDWDEADELLKLRPRAHLDMALKNRVGHKANDITFTTVSGKTMRLHDVQAEFTLLFINNPDCPACAELMADIRNSPILKSPGVAGNLKIVAVYPDEDITAWKNYIEKMPAGWINGYDANLTMRDQMTYDLKAIPTVYLLDKNKNVLIKDAAAVGPLEEYFYFNLPM